MCIRGVEVNNERFASLKGRVRWMDGSGWHWKDSQLPYLCETAIFHSVIDLRRLMKLLTINSDQNVYCTFNSWTSAPNWLSRGAPSWSIKFLSNSDSPIAKQTVCMGVLWIQSTWCYLILDARAWNFIAMYYVLFSSPSCLGFTMYTVQHRRTVSLRYV